MTPKAKPWHQNWSAIWGVRTVEKRSGIGAVNLYFEIIEAFRVAIGKGEWIDGEFLLF